MALSQQWEEWKLEWLACKGPATQPHYQASFPSRSDIDGLTWFQLADTPRGRGAIRWVVCRCRDGRPKPELGFYRAVMAIMFRDYDGKPIPLDEPEAA